MTYRFHEGDRGFDSTSLLGKSGELRAAGVGLTTARSAGQAMRSSSIASTLAVPTTHALSRRALSVAARCTGVSIAPCERTANAANAIY